MHRWKETGEVCDLIEKKLLLSGMDDEERVRWWPEVGHHEVTFAVELDPGVLHLYADRKDPYLTVDRWKESFDPQRFLTGTIDYLDGPWVDDLKTGWPVKVTMSKQLRSYALVPWLLRRRPASYRGLLSITHYPRYPLRTAPTRTWSVVTGAELELHLEDLRWAVTSPTIINPSEDACRFCPSRSHCPQGGAVVVGESG